MILLGDVLEQLRTLPDESVNCVVTSPPYWGLRDYGVDGQIGLEKTPAEYIARMVAVFEEVRRVLRKDGTCWVNLGDSYAGGGTIGRNDTSPEALARRAEKYGTGCGAGSWVGAYGTRGVAEGLKHKDLVGIPWRFAFALQDAGWYLRSEIIWSKPNPMPESVRDRPTKAHEQIFLLTRSAKYWYDADAIAEPAKETSLIRLAQDIENQNGSARVPGKTNGNMKAVGGETRNVRTVWEMATQPYKEAHFATFPPELPKRCILAGCPVGGVVLDPFLGSGTTAAVAIELGRKWIGIELNPQYAELARKRIANAQPALEVA